MTLIESPPTGSLCEIASVMAFAHHQVFGHWPAEVDEHRYCACPIPPESFAARHGSATGVRLVTLLTKFAYRVHTPDEQAEMLALIKEAA